MAPFFLVHPAMGRVSRTARVTGNLKEAEGKALAYPKHYFDALRLVSLLDTQQRFQHG
jgi:hypothetical protein